MTTFQALIHAVLHGLTQLFPLDVNFHHEVMSQILDWPHPPDALYGALGLGTSIALFVFFRDDWASMISSFIQIVLFRRKPMTVDERLPFYVILGVLPPLLAAPPLRSWIHDQSPSLILIGIIFAITAAPLLFLESFGKKTKRLLDWNWLDSILFGMAQIASLVPGIGTLSGGWALGFSRNYSHEAIAKMTFFTLFPMTLVQTVTHLRDVHFRSAMPDSELSWLSFILAATVALILSYLILSNLTRQLQKGTFHLKGLGIYRVVAGISTVVYLWWRSRES